MHRRTFLSAAATPLLAAPSRTRNLVLFTSDGLRWQDVFSGIDAKLMGERAAHMQEARPLRDAFWRESPSERRAALLPHFWTKLAPQGLVLDDVRVTNAFRVSYPGYSEILTGRAQDDVIQGNQPKQQPVETMLEFIQRKWSLRREEVAVFGSWGAFQWISEKTAGNITIQAGFAESNRTPRIAELSRLQREILTEDDDARHDYFTFEMALDYLKTVQPRVLYIALNETDEWAHRKRYDRYLYMVQYVDRCLDRLWSALQSMPGYRDSTALVVTADHGRGGSLEDWSDHGSRVEGADRIWLAAFGPDRLEMPARPRQRDIAPAILTMLGLDQAEYYRR